MAWHGSLATLRSFQTALFAAFGKDSRELVPVMNTAMGTVVCLGALVLGLHMIFDAKKRIRRNFK